eukprot:2534283-Prymnesium_polylepis.1
MRPPPHLSVLWLTCCPRDGHVVRGGMVAWCSRVAHAVCGGSAAPRRVTRHVTRHTARAAEVGT